MAKKENTLIIAILIIGILISGAACQPLMKKTTTNTQQPTSTDLKNIRTGTEGLEMEYVKGVPPDQVYDKENLEIMINVWNRGAENIDEAFFYIGGIDPNIVDFRTAGYDPAYGYNIKDIGTQTYLPGKNELRGEQGQTMLTFEGAIKELPIGTDVYEPNVVVTACYAYKTVANPIVCIDPNPFGVYTTSKACEPQTITEANGEGGPIAVTRVEQIPSRGRVQFKIYVENKDGGKVIADEKFQNCNLIEPTDYKYVNKLGKDEMPSGYSVTASGLTNANCQPSELRLIDEKGIIICSFNVDQNTPAFTTPLSITLEYNYMKSTPKKQIKILHMGS